MATNKDKKKKSAPPVKAAPSKKPVKTVSVKVAPAKPKPEKKPAFDDDESAPETPEPKDDVDVADVDDAYEERITTATITYNPELEPVPAEEIEEGKPRRERKAKTPPPVLGPVISRPTLPGLRLAPGLLARAHAPEKPAPVTVDPKKQKFTKKELEEIRKRLLTMRETSIANLRERLEEAQAKTEVAADVIDQASDACDEDVSMEIVATKDEQLQLINAALEKIDGGTYGVCIMCSGPISPTRLRLLPYVLRCKECRDVFERNRRRHDANWALMNNGLPSGDESEPTEEPSEE